ncbi:uncharacterized protein LOC135945183 isoform X2 [Cloeon dipterum]|uniref:uncharacterized protein LOC135945183 isoform X2 n=1 Tax=Cloeon dipterum TaxID=197152 RepID=UPI003220662D
MKVQNIAVICELTVQFLILLHTFSSSSHQASASMEIRRIKKADNKIVVYLRQKKLRTIIRCCGKSRCSSPNKIAKNTTLTIVKTLATTPTEVPSETDPSEAKMITKHDQATSEGDATGNGEVASEGVTPFKDMPTEINTQPAPIDTETKTETVVTSTEAPAPTQVDFTTMTTSASTEDTTSATSTTTTFTLTSESTTTKEPSLTTTTSPETTTTATTAVTTGATTTTTTSTTTAPASTSTSTTTTTLTTTTTRTLTCADFPASRYFFGSTVSTYADSRKACQSKRMDLAVFETELERTCTMPKVDTAFHAGAWIWIGKDNLGRADQKYVWINGANDTYSWWGLLQPQAPTVEQCVIIISQTDGGKWYDLSCNTLQSYACESIT